MKTPDRIALTSGGREKYNPEKDRYEMESRTFHYVPCFVNKVSQSKVFENYGNRTDTVISCRFLKKQEPFIQAVFNGEIYEPIEAIDAPIKGAIRLKKVGPYNG